MSKREGVLWEAMRAASELLDINREGMQGEKAFNADVTPVIDLAKGIVEKCAAISDAHAAHEHATSEEYMKGYKQASESIAASIRATVK